MRKGEDIAKDGLNTRWKPGQSGNPAGKPKGTEHSTTRLRRLLEAVQRAKNPITEQEEEFSTLELMDAAQIKKAINGDTLAYRELLDRFEGKVPGKTEMSGPDGGPIETNLNPVWVITKPPVDGTAEAEEAQ